MFYINPSPIAYVIPGIEHPITWYGISFAIGLMLSFWQGKKWVTEWLQLSSANQEELNHLLERLLFWSILGMVIGARSFEVLFYSPEIAHRGLEVFQTWHGGLSSHGGILGVFLAILLFWKKYGSKPSTQALGLHLSLLLDAAAGASGLCAYMIRLGNFINQEIVGTPSDLPWAVIFGEPAAGLAPVARHPVQLYEGFAYLAIWLFSIARLKKGPTGGKLFCEALIAIFACRILLETFKVPLLSEDIGALWQMGQILSFPALFLLIAVRLFFPFKANKTPRAR